MDLSKLNMREQVVESQMREKHRIHRASIALLASVCLSDAGPLHVNIDGNAVEVENPLSRGGHTHTHNTQ